jgi:integrase
MACRAVFDREEARTINSTPQIPFDRQIVYALELLAGVRPGEGAALHWRSYDPTKKPLGRLLVATSYNTRKDREKSTKTGSVRHVPVHPTLAAMLAEWKLSGWMTIVGRMPEPDDLIVPLPPEAAARRRNRKGEPFRSHDYSGKRWRDEDLPALGWRHRQHYDMKATFITLVVEDGADENVIRIA